MRDNLGKKVSNSGIYSKITNSRSATLQDRTQARKKVEGMRAPKQPFVFSQQNLKSYSCNQTAICFCTGKYEI